MVEPIEQIRPRSVMEDPSTQAVARVYAEAFLNASTSVGAASALEEFRSFLDDVLDRNAEFKRLILSGVVNRDDKEAMLKRTVGGRGTDFFVNFLTVLARHDRLDLLPQIHREAERQFEIQSGKRRVLVQSAVPLTADMQSRIAGSLRSQLGFEPILETEVHPSLLGGLVIRVGDTVYDSSLRTRLKQLRARFRQRKLHEIQSGRDRFSHSTRD